MERFFSKPRLIIAIIALITLFFSWQLTRVRIDNNNYRFIPADNPARVTAERIDDIFGSQITILVGLERRFGTVFESDFLRALREFDTGLSSLPLVDTAVSLVSTDYITGRDGAIIVEPLIPDGFSGSADEVREVKKRILSWDMYDRMLVSDDFSSTQVIVALDVTGENAGSPETINTFKDIRTLADRTFGTDGTIVHITGLPVFSSSINDAVLNDLGFLVPLVVLVVLAVLFFSFRRGFAVIVPIMTVLVATVWSVGAMPLFGISMSILTTVLPVILVAVGSAYGIHVVSHYIDEREALGNIDAASHRKLVFSLIKLVGKPVFLAALTTFAGFVSFCFTDVVPIREFGYFASFGVLVAFAVSMTLIPALFLVRGPVPLKRKKGRFLPVERGSEAAGDPLAEAIASSFSALVRGKRMILVCTAALIVLCSALIPRIIVDNVLVEYFREHTGMARSDAFIRTHFGGSKLVSLVVESDEAGGVLSPSVLSAMDGLVRHLETRVPEVGKVTSFTHLVKRINQVYNAGEDSSVFPAIAEPAGITASDEGLEAFGFEDFGFEDFGFGEDLHNQPAMSAPVLSAPIEQSSAAGSPDAASALSAALLASPVRIPRSDELVRSLARAVNLDGAAWYEIPLEPARYGQADERGLRNVIGNYMMLLSGDVSAFADDPLEPRAIRMNIQLRTVGQLDTDRAIAEIQAFVDARFPKDVRTTIGGFALVEGALNTLVVKSQLVSVFISLAIVFLIISVSYRSLAAGAIGIIPLALSILLNFAVMAYLGIKLNIGTALVASVAIGIGVDYIIHYLESYYREWRKTGGTGQFLSRTFASSGKAILINAVSVGAGFGVLAFSGFNILSQFGLLIAFTMATASLSSLTILPVLLNWFKPSFLNKEL